MRVDVESPQLAMLARFRDAIGKDPALAARLAAPLDFDAFATLAGHEAMARGIALTPAAVAATLRPDPLGIDRFALPRPTADRWPDADWLPVAVVDGVDGPVVEWLHFAGRRIDEPFFENSVRRARGLPLNRFYPVRTPLLRLAETMPNDAAFVPTGFVFHLSRCGSTLVAQMLAAGTGHIVASEPEPLDGIVRLIETGRIAGRDAAVALLRAMVAALLRDRHGDRRVGVVKLDCWHMLTWRWFAAAFPDVPFVFLYRDPVEILVSHARRPGAQTVPGMLPHLPTGPDDAADPAAYGARLLGRIADAAADAVADGRMVAVRYDRLPGAVYDRILPHFGMVATADDRATMQAAGLRDAKAPDTRFADDRATKQADAGEAIRARATACLAPAIARLDAMETTR